MENIKEDEYIDIITKSFTSLSADDYNNIMYTKKVKEIYQIKLKLLFKNYNFDKFLFVSPFFEHFNSTIKSKINDEKKWKFFKCLDDSGNINDEGFSKISSKCGGIYTFFVVSPIMPWEQKFIIYVGKATKTLTQNLKKEVLPYKKFIGKERETKERPTLSDTFFKLKNHLYCGYFEAKLSKSEIEEIETTLINNLIPICNPDQNGTTNISVAIRAFL